jgi:hypothetical protein
MTVLHVGPYADSGDRESLTASIEMLGKLVELLRQIHDDAVVLNALISMWMNLSLESFGAAETRRVIKDIPGSFEEGLLSIMEDAP